MLLDRINFPVGLSFLPEWCSAYAMSRLDTVPKLINHLLAAMAVCNAFFFFGSLRMSLLPAMGFNVVLVSLMLCIQNAVLWSVLNNGTMSSRFSLSSTDFMIGVSLGITIGASILTFVLSVYFHRLSKCESTDEVVSQFACQHYGGVVALWFWGGLLFWLNTAVALLIAFGKDDLIYHSQYEDIGLSLDEYEDHFRRYNAQYQQTLQSVHTNGVYEDVGDASIDDPVPSQTHQTQVTP